eukprot:m.226194 g.226194  ORF g.226194 m.226194 type:complete len:379 (+) comp89783_c0_seq1:2-1138(+)
MIEIPSVNAIFAKLNARGEIEWVQTLSTGFYTSGGSIAVDQSGNPVVVGQTLGSLPGQTSVGDFDFFAAKINGSDGTVLWINQFGTEENDNLQSVAISSNGDIYVVGYTTGSFNGSTNAAGSLDVVVAKLSPAGSLVWARQLNGNGQDMGNAVAVDNTNSAVYFTGSTADGALEGNPSAQSASFVAKYDMDGNKQWVVLVLNTTNAGINDIAVSSAGYIFLCGIINRDYQDLLVSGGSDAFLLKLDSSGTEVFKQPFGTTSDEGASSLAIASTGDVYMAGYTYGNLGYTYGNLMGQTNHGGSDLFVARYDGDGIILTVIMEGTSENEDNAKIAADAENNIVLIGSTGGTFPGLTSAGGSDMYVTKLRPLQQNIFRNWF